MPIKRIIVTKENPVLDFRIKESQNKKELLKKYFEENNTFEGAEEALGIKFTKPISFQSKNK